MTLPDKFLADPETTHKTLKWVIIIEIITTIIFILCLFYIMSNSNNKILLDPELTKELRQANAEYREVLKKSDEERAKTIEYLESRDSVLLSMQNTNKLKILENEKIHNEKFAIIDRYMSADIQREFAKIDSIAE